jgi:hypothetical protein
MIEAGATADQLAEEGTAVMVFALCSFVKSLSKMKQKG